MSKSPQTDQVWRRIATSGAPSEIMELKVLCERFERERGELLVFFQGLKDRLLMAGYAERGGMVSSVSAVIAHLEGRAA